MLALHAHYLGNLEDTYITGSSELLAHFTIPNCLSRNSDTQGQNFHLKMHKETCTQKMRTQTQPLWWPWAEDITRKERCPKQLCTREFTKTRKLFFKENTLDPTFP